MFQKKKTGVGRVCFRNECAFPAAISKWMLCHYFYLRTMARRRRKPLPLLENLKITDAAAKGKGLGKVDDLVVFTTGVMPGDVVDVQVTKKKSNFMEGRVVRFVSESPDRIPAYCDHFGSCGGCKWQFMPYEKQLFYKEKEVTENLRRLGKVELPDITPILPSPKTRYYRNKLEFTFSEKRWLEKSEMESEEVKELRGLGFHAPGRFDKVVDVEHCYHQADPSNAIRNAVRTFAFENDLTFYNVREHTGLLRNLIVRNTVIGEWMVILCLGEDNLKAAEPLLDHLAQEFPAITSLMYVINTKLNDTIADLDIQVFKGNDHIVEEMEAARPGDAALRFKVGPKSFYQTNSYQAQRLYQIAHDFAGLKGDETVYDLYTGTGTIALFTARYCKKMVGIEYVEAAIEDAKVNAELNGIENTQFFAGDMKDVLTQEFTEQHGHPDLVITDPPRAGMHEKVVHRLLEMAPEQIVYVSCNPATQARDLGWLDEQYRVEKVQPVDMFPQTHHVENVVLLKKRTKG